MEFLVLTFLGTPVWMWLTFIGVVIALLVLDLGVFHKTDHEIGVRESLKLSAFYITLGVLFSGFVWWQMDVESAKLYLTAFVVEKTLAMDNVFVIALIFSYFAIPRQYQHRVLFWGILGVIVLRALMIGFGAALVARFDWVLLIFAGFLMVMGVKMFLAKAEAKDPRDNALYRWAATHLRLTDGFRGARFVVREPGPGGRPVLFATPLLMVLVTIELADLIFAVDSVPAIFAITTDPYLVYTSNIFAILGLRALYFALGAVIDRFAYLKQALAALLVFIGGKVFVAEAMGWEKFPAPVSLGVTVILLACGIGYSVWRTRGHAAGAA